MNKPLVLVVEDDRPVRNLDCYNSEIPRLQISDGGNGKTAIMEASSHNPDIVLLDLDCRT